jgi:hypothetical protein
MTEEANEVYIHPPELSHLPEENHDNDTCAKQANFDILKKNMRINKQHTITKLQVALKMHRNYQKRKQTQ